MISLLQLQEQCGEQRQTLYIAYIDLMKVFDLVSRDRLFRVLLKIDCPSKLLSVIQSFHTDMKWVVHLVQWFLIGSGVKQGCVLALTLFGIFFAVMLRAYNTWWTNSLTPVYIFNWPSTWRKQTCSAKVSVNRLPSPSTTIVWTWLTNIPTLAKQWLTASPWTPRSARGLAAQLQLSSRWPKECGSTAGWPTRPKSLCAQSLRPQHAILWQRNLDPLYTGQVKRLLHVLPHA